MGAIVKELKEKITAAGGDTTGVQTVSEALDKLSAGGGSSLPTPSASNVGSALVVKKVTVHGDVIVPEQTGEDYFALANAVPSLMTEGTEVIAVINNEEYKKTVDGNGQIHGDEYGGWQFYYESDFDNAFSFYADDPGTYTVALYVADDDYKYELDLYPGYDIVVSTSEMNNTLSNYTITWDYPAVLAKVRAGEPVTGVLCYHYNYDESIDGDTDTDCYPLSDIQITSEAGFIIFRKIFLRPDTNNAINISSYAIWLNFFPETGELDNVEVQNLIKIIS